MREIVTFSPGKNSAPFVGPLPAPCSLAGIGDPPYCHPENEGLPFLAQALRLVLQIRYLWCRALGWIKKLTSPVYFSTGVDGVVRQGLQGVPQKRPMLFVGNHQTYALDIGPLVETLIKERGIFPRGLAHPAIWAVSRSARVCDDTMRVGFLLDRICGTGGVEEPWYRMLTGCQGCQLRTFRQSVKLDLI